MLTISSPIYRSIVLFGAALLGACAAPRTAQPLLPREGYVPMAQAKFQAKFDTTTIQRDTIAQTMSSCMNGWTSAGTQRLLSDWKYPLAQGITQVHSQQRNASFILMEGYRAVCIAQSEFRFPIVAGEALYKTANPVGAPPDVLDDWYIQIVRQMARAGTATVHYKFENGNAHTVKYWFDSSSPTPSTINYWSEFKKADVWSSAPSDLVFTHPGLSSFAVTQRNKANIKPFLTHQF